MTRAAQIGWWTQTIDAARHAIVDAQARRRRLDDEFTRARGVAPTAPQRARTHEIIRGETISGERDEERARRLPIVSGGGGRGGGTATPSSGRPAPDLGSGDGARPASALAVAISWPCATLARRLSDACLRYSQLAQPAEAKKARIRSVMPRTTVLRFKDA